MKAIMSKEVRELINQGGGHKLLEASAEATRTQQKVTFEFKEKIFTVFSKNILTN